MRRVSGRLSGSSAPGTFSEEVTGRITVPVSVPVDRGAEDLDTQALPLVAARVDHEVPHGIRVVGPDYYLAYPLPVLGSLVLGRGDAAQVRIDDPSVSRQHARITVREHTVIEDLGSANGTVVGGRRLEPGALVPVTAGQLVQVGRAMVLFDGASLPEGLSARGLRLHTEQGFQRRLVGELARPEPAVSILQARAIRVEALASGPATPEPLQLALARVVTSAEVVTRKGPDVYWILLPGASEVRERELRTALEREAAAAGFRLGLEVARSPEQGPTVEALLGHLERNDPDRRSARQGGRFVVADPIMQRLYDTLDRVAQGPISVLLLGETGVGKEVLAEALHQRSPRRDRPFVRLNCAALSPSLMESELFGHERGAFTGALQAKPGLLESAHLGTVFLDEIGELDLNLQAKLLRVLEDGSVLRVGGLRPQRVDVRFVSATNRDLQAEVERGRFRRDLYYRLNAVTLSIPPLRARRVEIPELAARFTREMAERCGRSTVPRLSPGALERLQESEWPGNIRELRNVIERAVLLSQDEITTAHLPGLSAGVVPSAAAAAAAAAAASGVRREPTPTPLEAPAMAGPPAAAPAAAAAPSSLLPSSPVVGELRPQLQELERRRVVEVMARCGGNQTKAASELGISRNTLVARLDAYGLPRPRKSRDGG